MRAEVWKLLSLKYSTVGQDVTIFLKKLQPAGWDFVSLLSTADKTRNKQKKKKKYTKTTLREAVSTQHLLFCCVFQVIYFCDFLPARKSASVKCCCFSLWPCDAALSEDAEMHCSYSGLWIYVLFPDAEESTALNDEQAASAPLPIKKLIVCPSRRGNDPLGFSLHISHAHSNSNATAFDFVCVHTEHGVSCRPDLHTAANSNSLIHHLLSAACTVFGGLLQLFLTHETQKLVERKRFEGLVTYSLLSCPQLCVFALFFCLHLSAHLHMSISQLQAWGTLCQR